jgi:type IV secretory pathway ATPase VirB11/archaellum biosynthesis ATPase
MFGGLWYRNNAIEKVIFNDPTTIVYWHDDTKTVVIYQNDKPFDREKGLAMAISAKSFGIEKIIFRNPDTIICWNDGSETMVSTQNDEPYDSEKGFYIAIAKKHFGNNGGFNNVFKKYLPKEDDDE